MNIRTWSLVASAMGIVASTAFAGPDVPLIPRATLFGNPDRANPQLSPDGQRLSFLAARDGVMNIWVAPAGDPSAAKPVTGDTKRGIRQYRWCFDNAHLLYLQDVGGDENWKVFSVDLSSGAVKDLTPFEEIKGPDGKAILLPGGQPLRPAAQIEHLSPGLPGHVLLGLNNRDPQYHDLYKVDVATGAMELVLKNEGYAGFLADDAYTPRVAMRQTMDGGLEYLKADGKGGFGAWQTVPMADSLSTQPLGFDPSGKVLYLADSRGSDTSRLMSVDLATDAATELARDAKADVGNVLVHPTKRTIQAASFEYDREHWTILDPEVKGDFDYLKTVADGEIGVASRSMDDTSWLVTFLLDDGPVKVYRYERARKDGPKATYLFSNRKSLEGLGLAKMRPVVIDARDGLKLVSYLTLPAGREWDGSTMTGGTAPLVLFVHGGPWARDSWGYNPYHQWLANRGYAVLSVNFRGSTGLGKAFLNAGNREWAGKMHDDLLDAVSWSVKAGIADKDKVAIMGGSYGGYATLVGLTFTPDVFACGVDIVGPSNITTLLSTIPPHWAPLVEQFAQRVGDHRTEAGKKFLDSRSPLTFVDKIKRPLLIGQGANDPRVKQSESDQIVSAMQQRGIPVTYVVFPDEGHGFARPENSRAFNAIVENFLARHLGGRSEGIGEDVRKSTAQVRAGAEGVAGLAGPAPDVSK